MGIYSWGEYWGWTAILVLLAVLCLFVVMRTEQPLGYCTLIGLLHMCGQLGLILAALDMFQSGWYAFWSVPLAFMLVMLALILGVWVASWPDIWAERRGRQPGGVSA